MKGYAMLKIGESGWIEKVLRPVQPGRRYPELGRRGPFLQR